ncbi:MAG: extracellular solute-binding protein [Coriobacteriia bacterium]|nr:extracellular solute-binding protein [Coriobacteriia bacterium]
MIDRLKGKAIWRFSVVFLAFALVFSLAGCAAEEEPVVEEPAAEEPVEQSNLVLASTTSTQDSGLFDVLIPAFEDAYPEYKVEVIAVGTGAALEMGENKDADVLLVHAKAREEELVANGFGEYREDVMYNDFIIVGPADDPAGIKGMSVTEALVAIADSESTFISRGDDSGTHTAEKNLWSGAGIEPAGDWYLSAGQGMGDVLVMASETPGYTMTDRATYLNMMDDLAVEILVEGDNVLFNQYGVIPVTGAANPEGAEAFAQWVTGDAQDVIKTYGEDKFGQPLFFPNAQ